MSVNGCDAAWQKPSGASLQAAGYKVVSLYVGQDNSGKNMTPEVIADYHYHNLAIITNFEYGAQQMLGGADQGRTDATLGHAQAVACGMPAGRPVYYSADWNVQAGEMPTVIAYLVAARSVTGPGTVGVYGSYATVKAVHEYWQAHFPGEKVYLWQSIAWSNGLVYSPLDAYQDGSTFIVGGIQVDYDLIISADAGQWPAPASPPPPAPTPPPPPAPEDTMDQKLVYDAVNKQQHFVYLAGKAAYHRTYDETAQKMSNPVALPVFGGGDLNPAAGVDAEIMMGGGQLHVFAQFADTSKGTGAHYFLSLPVNVDGPEVWGTTII